MTYNEKYTTNPLRKQAYSALEPTQLHGFGVDIGGLLMIRKTAICHHLIKYHILMDWFNLYLTANWGESLLQNLLSLYDNQPANYEDTNGLNSICTIYLIYYDNVMNEIFNQEYSKFG